MDVLLYGFINNVDEKLGCNGGKLWDYVSWLVKCVSDLCVDLSYKLDLYIDVYGIIGLIFDMDLILCVEYIVSL